MKKVDMRTLSYDERHKKRVQAIRLREEGSTYEEIASKIGLSRTGVFNVCKRHTEWGEIALRDTPTGRKKGEGRLLDVDQEAQIHGLITTKTPAEFKFQDATWTRLAVVRLIQKLCGVELAVRTAGVYLGRWGFNAQKKTKKNAPIRKSATLG